MKPTTNHRRNLLVQNPTAIAGKEVDGTAHRFVLGCVRKWRVPMSEAIKKDGRLGEDSVCSLKCG